jgi:hypothetical protein
VNAPLALLLGRFGVDQWPDLACHFSFDREVIAAMARHRGDTCFRLQADLDQAREGLRAIDCMDGRPGIDVGGHIGPKTDDVQLGFFRFRHGGTSERKAICTNISAEFAPILARDQRAAGLPVWNANKDGRLAIASQMQISASILQPCGLQCPTPLNC